MNTFSLDASANLQCQVVSSGGVTSNSTLVLSPDIDAMHILYGIDTDGDDSANTYVRVGNSVADMNMMFARRGSGILKGTYSQGPVTGLDPSARRALGRAYDCRQSVCESDATDNHIISSRCSWKMPKAPLMLRPAISRERSLASQSALVTVVS